MQLPLFFASAQAVAGKSRSLNNLVMHLRKACNHPYLMYPEYNPPNPLDTVEASGKFVLLDHVLPKLRRAGEVTTWGTVETVCGRQPYLAVNHGC